MQDNARKIAEMVHAAKPEIGEISSVDASGITLTWDYFDEDDFPPDDYDELELHYEDLKEEAVDDIVFALREICDAEGGDGDENMQPRPMARRVVIRNITVCSNIVENFDPIDIYVDIWEDTKEHSECESYEALVK